jgi:archaellum component FlaF (FlaF/FlaG flagellin family)
MAKRLRFNYTFTPASNRVVINGNVSQKRLLLITNTRTNQIIYNFSDPSRTATSVSYSSSADQTTITLTFNCSSMLSTDPLQIFTEEESVEFKPTEMLYDPVNKFRTSTPQALIDTDFEYGTQITKWENLGLVNNRPFTFPSAVGVGTIASITFPTGSKTVTVGLVTSPGPGVGTAITVQDTFLLRV